ncbi:thioredoxin [Paenibacillus sp. CCS19]|nr:thioredoxin [Paenibacillus cellulosilyticus]
MWMDRNRKLILVFLCIAALVVVAIVQYTQDKAEAETTTASKPKAGYPAPVIELPNLQDEIVTLGGKNDKIQLINFWAAWCGPCELEAPDLQKSFEKYGDKISFLGVNATKFDRERDARNFVDEQKLTFPILMDREGDATDEYKVKSFPTTFVVDNNGTIVERIDGVMTEEDVARIVKQYVS